MNKQDPTMADLDRRIHLLMTAIDQVGMQQEAHEYEEERARNALDVTLTMQYAHLKEYAERLAGHIHDLHHRVAHIESWKQDLLARHPAFMSEQERVQKDDTNKEWRESQDRKDRETRWGPRIRTKRPGK